MKLGLIAGNGSFPLLVLEGARKAGVSVAVAAIREETDPQIEKLSENVTWVGVGQLGKLLGTRQLSVVRGGHELALIDTPLDA